MALPLQMNTAVLLLFPILLLFTFSGVQYRFEHRQRAECEQKPWYFRGARDKRQLRRVNS